MSKRLSAFTAALSVLLLFSLLARADIPVPGETAAQRERRVQERSQRYIQTLTNGMPAPQPPAEAKQFPLQIEGSDPDINQIHLPAELLAELHAAAGPFPADDAPAGFPLRTMVAGVALALGLSIAGMKLARSGHRLAYGSMAAGLVLISLVGVSCLPDRIEDNHREIPAEPPPPLQPIVLQDDGTATGEVRIWKSYGKEVQMTLPQEPLRRLDEAKPVEIKK